MQEVTEFVYNSIHEKKTTEQTTYDTFHAFCLKNPNNIKFFNFLNSDNTEFIRILKLNTENIELLQKTQKIKEQLRKMLKEQTTRFTSFLPDEAQDFLSNQNPTKDINVSNQHLQKIESQIDEVLQYLRISIQKAEEKDRIWNQKQVKSQLESMGYRKSVTQKERVFMLNENWNIICNMIQGVFQSVSVMNSNKYKEIK